MPRVQWIKNTSDSRIFETGVASLSSDLRDTVVVASSDHGQASMEHGGWQHSSTVYEEMIHGGRFDEAVFSQTRDAKTISIQTADQKLMATVDERSGTSQPREPYDLAAGSAGTRNLLEDRGAHEALVRMTEQFARRASDPPQHAVDELSAEQRRNLEALGYIPKASNRSPPEKVDKTSRDETHS